MNLRFKALEIAQSRTSNYVEPFGNKISEYFACNVFNDKTMEQYLSGEAYEHVQNAIHSGEKITRAIANQVAAAMKTWAMSKGATHYTHWFQPLNGLTAEKHDSFFKIKNGHAIEEFIGDALNQQRPNAASFPTGGLRSTFEARGYTAWDPSSPAFIMEIGTGKTLCIPTIFVAYTGEALDYKAPLLKSQIFLEEQSVAVCQYFDRFVTKVTPMLGCEQEFFVVDEAMYTARPDLLLTGRTLLGKPSAKGQQLDDHYFGAIPDRIYAFLLDLEQSCHKLGIPVQTRHNEVAPSQFEIVPQFEEVNISVDHNQLLMDLLNRIAKRHGLRALIHEKPFQGINGSAKHNNWSLFTNTGKNLLAPGETPRKSMLFLTFLINTLKAIHDNSDVLSACVSSAGNDLRLGHGGAPPPFISVFIGEGLTGVLEDIEKSGDDWEINESRKQELKLDIHNKIPDLLLDNTDSNRTSPIAFTGDKFEFRMVGSSHNSASPMIVMNTIVGNQLAKFKVQVDQLIKKDKLKKDTAILRVLKKMITASKPILFEGDSNSADWKKELEKRKIKFADNTPAALDSYLTPRVTELFESSGVLTGVELKARRDNLLRRYNTQFIIESNLLSTLCRNQIFPAVLKFQTAVALNLNALKNSGVGNGEYPMQQDLLSKLLLSTNHLESLINQLEKTSAIITEMSDLRKKSGRFFAEITPLMASIRDEVDTLEYYVADEVWPLPKYRELLFLW